MSINKEEKTKEKEIEKRRREVLDKEQEERKAKEARVQDIKKAKRLLKKKEQESPQKKSKITANDENLWTMRIAKHFVMEIVIKNWDSNIALSIDHNTSLWKFNDQTKFANEEQKKEYWRWAMTSTKGELTWYEYRFTLTFTN